MLTGKYCNYRIHLHEQIYYESWELMNLYILYHKNYTDISFLYVLTEYVHLEYLYVVLYIYILNMDTWNPDELTFYVLLDYSVLLLDNHKLCRDISFLHDCNSRSEAAIIWSWACHSRVVLRLRKHFVCLYREQHKQLNCLLVAILVTILS